MEKAHKKNIQEPRRAFGRKPTCKPNESAVRFEFIAGTSDNFLLAALVWQMVDGWCLTLSSAARSWTA